MSKKTVTPTRGGARKNAGPKSMNIEVKKTGIDIPLCYVTAMDAAGISNQTAYINMILGTKLAEVKGLSKELKAEVKETATKYFLKL